MKGYAEKVKSFLREHIHDDEESRAVLEGCGYFDIKVKLHLSLFSCLTI